LTNTGTGLATRDIANNLSRRRRGDVWTIPIRDARLRSPRMTFRVPSGSRQEARRASRWRRLTPTRSYCPPTLPP